MDNIINLAKECYQQNQIYPISFSFHDFIEIPEINFKNKIKKYGEIIPDKKTKYKFNNEKDYFEDYQKSKFGLTQKKGGWDCNRHLEIMFNKSLPLFKNIKECPKFTLVHYPKDLFEFIIDNQNELENNEELYNLILNKIYDHSKKFLTNEFMIKYILTLLNYSFENINQVLFIDEVLPNKCDYLSMFIHNGLKILFKDKCHVLKNVEYLYQNNSIDKNTLYGKGFSYYGILNENLKTIVSEEIIYQNILEKKYDLIFYGSVSRSLKYFDIISKKYNKNQIIGIHGEDKKNKRKYKDTIKNLKTRMKLFVREIY